MYTEYSYVWLNRKVEKGKKKARNLSRVKTGVEKERVWMVCWCTRRAVDLLIGHFRIVGLSQREQGDDTHAVARSLL